MKRRDFIQSVGAVGMVSLLGRTAAHAAAPNEEAQKPSALKGPFDLAFDPSGNLFVSDPCQYRVLRLDSLYSPVSSLGGAGSEKGRLNFPMGLTVDGEGSVYVVDSNNCRIQVFDQGGTVKRVLGTVGSVAGCFAAPQSLCLDADGKVLVADTRNHRIQIFQGDKVIGVIGELGDDADQFRLPTAVVMSPDREILVLDSKHGLVKVFGEDLKFRRSFAGQGSGDGMLNMPQGMRLDEKGRLWVADTGNHRVQEFSVDGKLVSMMRKVGEEAFRNPTSIAFRKGIMYVADNGNGKIQVVPASTAAATLSEDRRS